MNTRTRRALQIGGILLVALALTALPGGDSTLRVILTLLSIVFFAAIAFLGYRLFRQFRSDLEDLDDRVRLVLYGSVGAAFLTFVATARLFDQGGFGVLTWLAMLSLCAYGLYWTWLQYRGDRGY